MKENVSQIQTLKCDFCGEAHANGNYIKEVRCAEVQYASFQKNNPYSNTYNWVGNIIRTSSGATIRI